MSLPTGRNKYFPGFMKKGATAFDEMSNFFQGFLNQLEEKYQVFQTKVDSIVQITEQPGCKENVI